jgi:hypothetical protein
MTGRQISAVELPDHVSRAGFLDIGATHYIYRLQRYSQEALRKDHYSAYIANATRQVRSA